MNDASEYSNPPAHTFEGAQHRIDELVSLTTGLCVREKDLDRLARWAIERARALGLALVCVAREDGAVLFAGDWARESETAR